MACLLRVSRSLFAGQKQKMGDAFKQFLEHDAGASVRQAPHQKDRKYVNVEISEEFRRQEQSRKQLRLEHMRARKKLLEQRLSTESRLLTSQESLEMRSLSEEITSLERLLEAQGRELASVESRLWETEADLVLVEGGKKLVVLNRVEYLKHMNFHPSGLVLHPEVMKMIENVHYLVNNNLPVNKFKLYELMPELFRTEIKELDTSIQRLIQEKQLDPKSDPSGRIRFFFKHNQRFEDPEQDIIDLQDQRNDVYMNMELEIVTLMGPHRPYIRLVDQGLTPFRNTLHLISVMLSDSIQLQFTAEEEALRLTLRDIVDLKEKFEVYNEEVNTRVITMRYKYVEPPVWVKNHPLLMERYEKIMVKYTNPTEVAASLPDSTPDDGGRAYLEEHLQNLVLEKYHPRVQKLWNEGRREQLIAGKKQMEIEFYNDSTKVLEEYQEMLADQREKDEFLKIPKKPRELAEQRHASLSLDDLTKAVLINNSNPSKYGLSFFAEYLGLESEEEARKLFNSFSYLRVMQQEERSIEHLQFEVIKFKG